MSEKPLNSKLYKLPVSIPEYCYVSTGAVSETCLFLNIIHSITKRFSCKEFPKFKMKIETFDIIGENSGLQYTGKLIKPCSGCKASRKEAE